MYYLLLLGGCELLRQHREHARFLHQAPQPISLRLQGAVCCLGIEPRIDADGREALVVQDALNRRKILARHRQLGDAGSPKVVKPHIVHLPAAPDRTPHLFYARF